MRISDWSSDVCSSDLPIDADDRIGGPVHRILARRATADSLVLLADPESLLPLGGQGPSYDERRVGNECVRTGRSRWSPDHEKKTHNAQNLVVHTHIQTKSIHTSQHIHH